jgi:hypothetical protein
MGPALFAITLEAMKSDIDEVRKQYLHFTPYYKFIESYMGTVLFAITLEAMKSDIDEVRKQ